jgi:oligoribonuclease
VSNNDLSNQRLVWIDLEMTGLDPKINRIIEIATLITDGDLNVVAKGPEFVVHQPDTELAKMDAWNVEHHGASGLTQRVQASPVSEAQAEAKTLAFVLRYCQPGSAPLCGNSIGQDRRFLEAYMPRLHAAFHYRSVDVTAFKVMAKHWYPDFPEPAKSNTHRALDDILESIDELRYYRRHLMLKKARRF